MVEALKIVASAQEENARRMTFLRDKLEKGLIDTITGGAIERRRPEYLQYLQSNFRRD